ncbi:MAG: site-2 protease family protein [Ignavibacterium album]|jgi:Zn-dependent protease|uniref:Site-2 protease family protein n=1 Tax=Ignavibacterium album TaxID=591197 RepID=A0A7V2ZH92_9BACT|nr:site-2 protease family protein [Ignavibacterium album]MCX8105244.1 site-2 protease family protein [Ignavibacterium album]
MPDIQVSEKLILFLKFIPVFLISITVHEFAHAFSAKKFGDATAEQQGRYSLNPIKHIDPIGSLLLPFLSFFSGSFLIGWAKPVPVNPNNFRNPLRDNAIVSFAGPLSNFVLAIILFIVFALLQNTQSGLANIFYYGTVFNIFLFCFNLLPIPPLDGSHILFSIFPNRFTAQWLNLGFYGSLVLLFFIFSPLWKYFLMLIQSILKLFLVVAGIR